MYVQIVQAMTYPLPLPWLRRLASRWAHAVMADAQRIASHGTTDIRVQHTDARVDVLRCMRDQLAD